MPDLKKKLEDVQQLSIGIQRALDELVGAQECLLDAEDIEAFPRVARRDVQYNNTQAQDKLFEAVRELEGAFYFVRKLQEDLETKTKTKTKKD